MIELCGVTKYYPTSHGRKYVLRDVDLRLPTGRNIAVLGANGAGKSTFVRLVGGIDFPERGKILTDQRVSWPLALAGGFQRSLTGRQNAQFVCRIYGVDREQVRQRVEFVRGFAELGDYFDMPVGTYSSGMRSRLAFSLSMAFDFDVYLMDEVSAVGDQAFKEKSARAIEAMRGRGSVILVSHSTSQLRRLCDVGIVLGGGRLQAFDTVDEAIRCYQASIGASEADLDRETRRAERQMAREEARFGSAGRLPVSYDGWDH